MSGGNDGTGGADGKDGPGDGRREWPTDHRVAFAEPLVEFKELEGRMNISEARAGTVFERVEASIARLGKDAAERENRIVKWMAALVGGATAALAAVMAVPALFGPGAGN